MAVKDSKQYIKNATAFNSNGRKASTNIPSQYRDRQSQYMSERNMMFDENRSYLASDYVNADVQGLTNDNFYEWKNTNIRLADSDISFLSGKRKSDDFKQILFSDGSISYFPVGAKVKTMGSIWLCVNAKNISNARPTAIVARCNASYNSYDYYGNVVTEPIVVESPYMAGSSNRTSDNIVLMSGSFNVTCQLNDNTQQLQENSRIILGKRPYHITGLTDFIQEFTGDRESCRLLTFSIHVEEPTENDDLGKNFIANGDDDVFDCILQSVDNIGVGESVAFTPHFIKDGEKIESTEEHPITWSWGSSDNSILSVDSNGVVTALSNGSAYITVKMVQNNSISAVCYVTTIAKTTTKKDEIVFTSVIPESISQFDSAVITAVYKENGVGLNTPLQWTFKGASKEDYTAIISDDGMSVEITCLSPSARNLKVTASYNSMSVTATIALVGY